MPKKEKPPTKKALLQADFDVFANEISLYIGMPMRLQFSRYDFPVVIQGIELIKVSKIKPPLEKRLNADGKQYTPSAFMVTTDVGELLFILEDTHIDAIFNGFQLTIGDTIVRMTKV